MPKAEAQAGYRRGAQFTEGDSWGAFACWRKTMAPSSSRGQLSGPNRHGLHRSGPA